MKPLALALAGLLAWANPALAAVTPAPAAEYPPTLQKQLKSLQTEALGSRYGYRLLAELSDGIGPRMSGSLGLQTAIDHIASEGRKAGLEVRLEPVTVPNWQRGQETAELVDWPGRRAGLTQTIALTALGNSAATPAEGITAEVVLVADTAELQRLGREKVAGKIVLFTLAFDEEMAELGHGREAYSRATAIRSRGPDKAALLGAAACLVRSAGGGHYRLPHTGRTIFEPGTTPIPTAAVTAEDAELITRLGKVSLHLTLTPQTLPDAESANVVAELRGSSLADEVVLVSGHLDSWDLGSGAIDDGAGIAIAFDALRLIAASGYKPRRTLRFVAYTNEENGLAGASAYAARHAAELPRHVAAIESDLGAGHPTGFLARVREGSEPLLLPMATALDPIAAGFAEVTLGCPGADIRPLCDAGIPAFAPRQDNRTYFTYHHTAADTLDKVNPEHLAENTAVVASLLWALGNGEALPRLLPASN